MVPGLVRQALDLGEARGRVDRLGPGVRQIGAEDRVVRLVHDLERLDAIARAQDAASSRTAAPRRRRTPPRRGSRRSRSPATRPVAAVAASPSCRRSQPACSPSARRLAAAEPRPARWRCAKPTATGVNELRPPDAMAAHQAASTSRPEASPTPSVSPAGASRWSRPTKRATHDAEQQAHRADQQALADRQPDRRIGQRDRELSKHGRTIPSALGRRPRPDGQGSRSTWVSPLVAIGIASGTSVFGCIASA